MADPQPASAATAAGLGVEWGARRARCATRSAVIIFSIITLGIYLLVWTYKVFKENKEFSGDGSRRRSSVW